MESDLALQIVSKKFPQAGIGCLLIGGHAVNHYGFTRATQDIDFMVAAGQIVAVREIMRAEGFSNIAQHDTVTFFVRPGSAFRVDFLAVDEKTLASLRARSTRTMYEGHMIEMPSLEDLISMKLFALKAGSLRRVDKDLPDIVNLILLHHIALEQRIKPLCKQFADDKIYQIIAERVTARINES